MDDLKITYGKVAYMRRVDMVFNLKRMYTYNNFILIGMYKGTGHSAEVDLGAYSRRGQLGVQPTGVILGAFSRCGFIRAQPTWKKPF